MKKLYLKEISNAHIGIGLIIEEGFAVLEIAVSEDKEAVRDFCLLENEWWRLSNKKTNLLPSPFIFVQFFRENWADILCMCKEYGVEVIVAKPNFLT